jgi:hypothetical protein
MHDLKPILTEVRVVRMVTEAWILYMHDLKPILTEVSVVILVTVIVENDSEVRSHPATRAAIVHEVM